MLPLPLYLLRVLDLTTGEPGAFATRHLADFGAEVIKVEAPGGVYPLRQDEALFASLNRNKFSVALDLRHPDGAELALRLAAQCSITLTDAESSAPSYAALQEARADLIVLKLPESASAPALVGLTGAGAVLAALFHRRVSGEGQLVQVDVAALEGNLRLDAVAEGRLPEREEAPQLPGAELIEDPYLRARGFFEPVAADASVRELDGVAYRFGMTPAHIRLPAPRLGEHTDYVLREIARLKDEEIERYRAAGVIA